jgi:hypothetical protein
VTVAVDASGTSVHQTGPKEWQAKIGKIPVAVALERLPEVTVKGPRIALIDALAHSPAPINAVLARERPEARRMNLLDDSLSADLARTGSLDAGDGTTHDRLAAQAALQLAEAGCAVIALAQFSLARARDAVAQATGLPVLTTPDSAVARLKKLLAAA